MEPEDGREDGRDDTGVGGQEPQLWQLKVRAMRRSDYCL
jgi:hypothetical protein